MGCAVPEDMKSSRSPVPGVATVLTSCSEAIVEAEEPEP